MSVDLIKDVSSSYQTLPLSVSWCSWLQQYYKYSVYTCFVDLYAPERKTYISQKVKWTDWLTLHGAPGQKPNLTIQSVEHVAWLATSFCGNRIRVTFMLCVSKETIYMGIIGVYSLLRSCCCYCTSQNKTEWRAKTPLLAHGAQKSHSLIFTSHYYCKENIGQLMEVAAFHTCCEIPKLPTLTEWERLHSHSWYKSTHTYQLQVRLQILQEREIPFFCEGKCKQSLTCCMQLNQHGTFYTSARQIMLTVEWMLLFCRSGGVIFRKIMCVNTNAQKTQPSPTAVWVVAIFGKYNRFLWKWRVIRGTFLFYRIWKRAR